MVESDMLQTPDLRSLNATLTNSVKVLEKVLMDKETLENLSKEELAHLKINIAEELDKLFTSRKTVNDSFRTH